MKFKDSGLPNTKLLVDAFIHSYNNVMSSKDEAIEEYNQQIEGIYAQNVLNLNMQMKDKKVSETDFHLRLEALGEMRDIRLASGPRVVQAELERIFVAHRLNPALEILNHSENPAPALMASVLLLQTVRSPIDYQRLEQKFGTAVAGLVGELLHIEAYPSEKPLHLGKAGADTKRAHTALMVASLEQASVQADRAAKQNPPQKVMFPPGQEQTIFTDAQLTWGNDKKLDSRFKDSFNRAAEKVNSPFALRVSNQGALQMGPRTPLLPPPPGFTPPKPPGSLGGDVF